MLQPPHTAWRAPHFGNKSKTTAEISHNGVGCPQRRGALQVWVRCLDALTQAARPFWEQTQVAKGFCGPVQPC